MRPKYFIIIIILLIVINFLLLNKNYILKKQIKEGIDTLRNNSIQIESIPNFILYDLNGLKYSSKEISSSSPYTLLVFFSLTDCATCLGEKDLWNKISEQKKVKILGIARHLDERELRNWIKNTEIFFPVLWDIEYEVTKKFGINKTPLKVLINDEGKILLIDRVRVTSSDQEDFIKILDEIIGN